MEASGVVTDGGEATEGGEGQGQEQQGPDFAPVLDRMSEFEQGLTERLDGMEQRFSAPQGQEDANAPPGAEFVDDAGNFFDANGQPLGGQPGTEDGFDPAQVTRMVDQRIQQGIQEGMKPFHDYITDQEVAGLEDQYADLRDPEKAQAAVESAKSRAQEYGQPELWRNPKFVEDQYLAGQARERAGQETSAGTEPGVHLEGGSPAGTVGQVDEAQEIVNAGRGNGFW